MLACRAAIEYEKKGYAENYEHGQVMEKNLISMARELEKLRAEIANTEKRARASAAVGNPSVGYNANYGNPEAGYAGNPYPATYGMNPVSFISLRFHNRSVCTLHACLNIKVFFCMSMCGIAYLCQLQLVANIYALFHSEYLDVLISSSLTFQVQSGAENFPQYPMPGSWGAYDMQRAQGHR